MEENILVGYTAIASEHALRPCNCGPLEGFDSYGRVTGPCGETMQFWLVVKENILAEVSFETNGCEPSRACGSMLTMLARGESMTKAQDLRAEDLLSALGQIPQEGEHCATLAVNTLKKACRNYLRDRSPEADDRIQVTQIDTKMNLQSLLGALPDE